MTLERALNILARVHTGDDPEMGFVVHGGAVPDWTFGVGQSDYVEAWRTVREHINMPTKREQYPAWLR